MIVALSLYGQRMRGEGLTKQELKKYKEMDCELKRLEDKIMEIETKLYSVKNSTLSDMPKGGLAMDMADKIARLVDLKALYNDKWDKLISERIRIEKAINNLDDSTERALMGYKYIDGLTWEEVCVKINYSWRQTHYVHCRALKNISK